MKNINLAIHSSDQMYTAFHGEDSVSTDFRDFLLCEYYRKGYELALIVKKSIEQWIPNKETPKILELPSGFGRVTRHLRAMYPKSLIDCVDVEPEAVSFLTTQFGVNATRCEVDDWKYEFLNSSFYDLGVMGSLITHFNEQKSKSILLSFFSKIAPGGVAIVTFHGERSYELMKQKNIYQVQPEDASNMLRGYETVGFGFAKYKSGHSMESGTTELVGHEYGFSMNSLDWLLAQSKDCRMELVECRFGAWDDHQDVAIFRKV